MNLTVNNIEKDYNPVKTGFEELYIAVRRHEAKLYTDKQLRHLPDFDAPSLEWKIRKRSSNRLTAYLQKKHSPLNILEIGCGNGWLAAKLAHIPNTQVTGLDINKTEIDQAKRVFKNPNLTFVAQRFNENLFGDKKFDVIVFAASVSYFPSVINILREAMQVLNPGGEIHIIDTPFYTPAGAANAAARCRAYYADMGIPKMAGHYFHHLMSDVWRFNYQVLFDPATIINRLFYKDPFYWICITNELK